MMDEEEIKIQNLIEHIRFGTQLKYDMKAYILALEGILDLYNKQKEINQYNDKEIKYLNCCIKSYGDNYIDKDKIKEKIKEVESGKENYTFEKLTSEDIRRTIITNLQELLGE